MLTDFDDPDAGISFPNPADGGVDDDLESALERESTRVLVEMTAKDLTDAFLQTKGHGHSDYVSARKGGGVAGKVNRRRTICSDWVK